MSGLLRLPGDEAPLPDSRATRFVAAIRAIGDAHRKVEDLQDDLFGYQLREVIGAKLSVREAEQRLIAVANLGGPNSPAVRRSQPVENV